MMNYDIAGVDTHDIVQRFKNRKAKYLPILQLEKYKLHTLPISFIQHSKSRGNDVHGADNLSFLPLHPSIRVVISLLDNISQQYLFDFTHKICRYGAGT